MGRSCKLKLKLKQFTFPDVFTVNKICNDNIIKRDIKYNRHKTTTSFLE